MKLFRRLLRRGFQVAHGGRRFSSPPGTEEGGPRLVAVFTCNVCETRSAKQFSRHAYEKGVVVVQCPNCKNYHLLADRLGIFEENFDVADLVRRQSGEKDLTYLDDNLLADLTPERLLELVAGRTSSRSSSQAEEEPPPPRDDDAGGEKKAHDHK